MVYVPDVDIDRLIQEDAGLGDLTTTALGINGLPGVMRFTARHAMVVRPGTFAVRVARHALDPGITTDVELAPPS